MLVLQFFSICRFLPVIAAHFIKNISHILFFLLYTFITSQQLFPLIYLLSQHLHILIAFILELWVYFLFKKLNKILLHLLKISRIFNLFPQPLRYLIWSISITSINKQNTSIIISMANNPTNCLINCLSSLPLVPFLSSFYL